MAEIKLPDPPLSGGKPDERLRRLESWANQLDQQLRFILTHLDDKNFTPVPVEAASEGGTSDGDSSATT